MYHFADIRTVCLIHGRRLCMSPKSTTTPSAAAEGSSLDMLAYMLPHMVPYLVFLLMLTEPMHRSVLT